MGTERLGGTSALTPCDGRTKLAEAERDLLKVTGGREDSSRVATRDAAAENLRVCERDYETHKTSADYASSRT